MKCIPVCLYFSITEMYGSVQNMPPIVCLHGDNLQNVKFFFVCLFFKKGNLLKVYDYLE